jgi:methylated-DNA-[protein]-cysteine S-methyltransferase
MAATRITASPSSQRQSRPTVTAMRKAGKSASKTRLPQTIRSPHFVKDQSINSATTSARRLTPYQRLVYAHLLCIPAGRITSYLVLSRAVAAAASATTKTEQAPKPSARAVGGALRNNPFAPTVPCHRVIAHSGYVGGFKGEWFDAPSGVNQVEKLDLLRDEGVDFDHTGKLLKDGNGDWVFDGPWMFEEHIGKVDELCAGL